MFTIVTTHEVLPGETMSGIAAKSGVSLASLIAVNSQVSHPDVIVVGQILNIPGAEVIVPTPATGHTIAYDGVHPAPGTVVLPQGKYAGMPLTNSMENRSAVVYAQVINQFGVEGNPRYAKVDGRTWCNIFLWDVTRAMGVEIPHWVTSSGDIGIPGATGTSETLINGVVTWMFNHGVPTHNWKVTTPKKAQDAANQGKVAVVMWKNPTGGHGHTAIIRPGSITAGGASTAQAGSHNFNNGNVKSGFGSLDKGLNYFWHD